MQQFPQARRAELRQRVLDLHRALEAFDILIGVISLDAFEAFHASHDVSLFTFVDTRFCQICMP